MKNEIRVNVTFSDFLTKKFTTDNEHILLRSGYNFYKLYDSAWGLFQLDVDVRCTDNMYKFNVYVVESLEYNPIHYWEDGILTRIFNRLFSKNKPQKKILHRWSEKSDSYIVAKVEDFSHGEKLQIKILVYNLESEKMMSEFLGEYEEFMQEDTREKDFSVERIITMKSKANELT